MRLIAWLGIGIIIASIVLITFGGLIVSDNQKDSNTWHWVAIIGGFIFAIIGIVMVIKGATTRVGKNNVLIEVPRQFKAPIVDSIKNFYNTGEKPCFFKENKGFFGMFKSGKTKSGETKQGEPTRAEKEAMFSGNA